MIKNYGVPSNYNTETYEKAHVKYVKSHRNRTTLNPELYILKKESEYELHKHSEVTTHRRNDDSFLLGPEEKINIEDLINYPWGDAIIQFINEELNEYPEGSIQCYKRFWSEFSKMWLSNTNTELFVEFITVGDIKYHVKVIKICKYFDYEFFVYQQFEYLGSDEPNLFEEYSSPCFLDTEYLVSEFKEIDIFPVLLHKDYSSNSTNR